MMPVSSSEQHCVVSLGTAFNKRREGELSPAVAITVAIVIHAVVFYCASRGVIQRATIHLNPGTGNAAVPVTLVASVPKERSLPAAAEEPNPVVSAPSAPDPVRKSEVTNKESAPASVKPKIEQSKVKPASEKKSVENASKSAARSDSQSVTAPSNVNVPSTVSETDRKTNDNGTEQNGAATPLVRGAPDYLVNPPPQYPAASRRLKEEGVVLLTVKISAEGAVTSAAIRQSSGFERLDDAALKAVQGWRFKPSRIGGIAMADTVEVPVRFALR